MTRAECRWIVERLSRTNKAQILDIGGGTHYSRLKVQPYVAYDLYRPLLLKKNRIVVLDRGIVHRKKDVVYSIPLEILSRFVSLFPSLLSRLSSVLPLAQTIFGDCHEISQPDERYDVVFLLNVLEHVKNPVQVLTEAVRVLKKGGLAFVSIPEICPYHPAPIDTQLRMKLDELASFASSHLRVLDKNSVADEPSCTVSILYGIKE